MFAPTPIRYAAHDAVESWLNELLCLDAKHEHVNANRLVCGTPSPEIATCGSCVMC